MSITYSDVVRSHFKPKNAKRYNRELVDHLADELDGVCAEREKLEKRLAEAMDLLVETAEFIGPLFLKENDPLLDRVKKIRGKLECSKT